MNIHTFRPQRLNSLDFEMIEIILNKLKEWHISTNIPKVVFMQGSGQKAFWAGGDIRAVYDAITNGINQEALKEITI